MSAFLNMLLTPADGGILKLFHVFADSKRVEDNQYATMEISKRLEEISVTKEMISIQEISYESDSLSYQPMETSLKVVQSKPEIKVPSESELVRKPEIEMEVAPSKGMLAWSWGFLQINNFTLHILKHSIHFDKMSVWVRVGKQLENN